MVAQGEGAKIPPKGKILLLPNCRRGVASLKRRGISTSAEVDLRNFFEKKFLKNFPKTFPLLLTFVLIKIENFRAEGDGNSPSLFTVHCPLSTVHFQRQTAK